MREIQFQESVMQWLLAGDPAIRWKTLRDLAGAENEAVEIERGEVARQGWGARLLACQDPDGRWGGQLYINKWLSTTYSMLLLRSLGLDPAHPRARLACRLLLDGGMRPDGSVCYGKTVNRADNGVTGMILALGAYFLPADWRVHALAGYLAGAQKADGSWDPEEEYQDFRYGFHATLLILDGLLEYARSHPAQAGAALEALAAGQEYLLRFRLFKGVDGLLIDPGWLKFSFPTRWFYDILAALDHFQECGAGRDPRLEEAVALVKSRRGQDGTWKLQNRHPGKSFFEMEEVGKPSRWNTLRALRVLKWWEA
jgi:hypothetical protein